MFFSLVGTVRDGCVVYYLGTIDSGGYTVRWRYVVPPTAERVCESLRRIRIFIASAMILINARDTAGS